MRKRIMTEALIRAFVQELTEEERSRATIEKYTRDVHKFFSWLPEPKQVTKELTIEYKSHLIGHYSSVSINSMLAALNHFFRFQSWNECAVRSVRTQRRVFCSHDKELSKDEYMRLLHTARKAGNWRLHFIMQTICATGIRVSELEYITVEAVRRGRAEVNCKGKTRIILLSRDLCQRLMGYITRLRLTDGPVFVTRSGAAVNRSNIWGDMKRLCALAGVAASKVFPHNLRHLFARTFYSLEKDLTRLADILGHSSIETTRIYTMTTGIEELRKLDEMGLLYQTSA